MGSKSKPRRYFSPYFPLKHPMEKIPSNRSTPLAHLQLAVVMESPHPERPFYNSDSEGYTPHTPQDTRTYDNNKDMQSRKNRRYITSESRVVLEWLSQFVDDSTSGLSLVCPTGSLAEKTRELDGSIPIVQKTWVPCFPAPVPGKTRSKQSKQNRRNWSLTSSSVSTTSSSSSYGSSTDPVQDTYCFSSVENQLTKKQKRKSAAETGSFSQTVRRCTHCHVQKTPQWRAGLFGPKTLCNACGVRVFPKSEKQRLFFFNYILLG
ncbi:putative GATA transcription factor 5-like [Forsythia ovata]|uniref:GATA transcription factor 5-like n=1 Tax=Forsythia ovata TaxID=205694 RepID=A0ABD1X294_9LAMI